MDRLVSVVRGVIKCLIGAVVFAVISILYDMHEEREMVNAVKRYEGKVLPSNLEDEMRRYSARIDCLENEIQILRFRRNWRILKAMYIDYSLHVVVFTDQENLVKGVAGTYWPTWEIFK